MAPRDLSLQRLELRLRLLQLHARVARFARSLLFWRRSNGV